MVRGAIAARFSPFGLADQAEVAEMILAAEEHEGGAVMVHVSSDLNAIAAEKALAAAGARVHRDKAYDPFAWGNSGVRLIVHLENVG